MKNSSIFNEVLGPIMIGPSSSHTAGPSRIGKIANILFDDEIKEIEISFDKEGSFAATYHAQGSDFGFVGGILGYDTSDEAIRNSLKEAAERGIKVSFVVKELENVLHPNHAILKIIGRSGKMLNVEAISTGGGMFEVVKYNGFPVSIKGDSDVLLIISRNKDITLEIDSIFKNTGINYMLKIEKAEDNELYLISLDADTRLSQELRDKIKCLKDIVEYKYVYNILPVIKKRNPEIPFSTAAEALEFSIKNKTSLWELACCYEEAISGEGRQEIINKMIEIVKIMRYSGNEGVKSNLKQRGFLPPKARIINENISKKDARMIDMGMLNKVMVWATGIMEYDICMGKIVAAPTGGSCGVLPATIVLIGDEMLLSDERIAKSMMVAGLIGVFIDRNATFAAETCGCQAENGSASAMAAAGIVDMLNGTVKEGFEAASLALENLMGLICDPVAGVGNIPCVSRNPMAAMNAVLSANMVLNGFDPYIPLDETIDAMMKVGNIMPSEHRCTGRGGLCITKSAQCIKID